MANRKMVTIFNSRRTETHGEKTELVIFKAQDGNVKLDVKLENETVWLTQNQMSELFQTTKQNVSLHLNNVFKDGELDKNSTVKEYLIVQKEGNRQVSRKTSFYNLDVIISVGYRVKSQLGVELQQHYFYISLIKTTLCLLTVKK